MKKLILLIEDSVKEIQKAKSIFENHLETQLVIATTLYDAIRILNMLSGDLSGVITDLYFPRKEGGVATMPQGLVIVVEAVNRKLPLVVCSSQSNHDADYLKIVIGALCKNHSYGLARNKDWEEARLLIEKMTRKGEDS